MKKTIFILLALLASAVHVCAQSGGLENATRGFPVNNDGTTGTILNGTAKVNSSGNAIAAGTSDTNVPTYIVIGGAGTSGNAVLAKQGSLAPCLMDSTIASGAGHYYVVQSTTNANECHAQSSVPVTGVWVIGFMHDQATTSGQTALVEVNLTVGGFSGNGSTASITQSVPTELLINGSGSATGTNFAITKNTEKQAQAWLTPAQPGLTNVVQSATNNCGSGTSCTVTFNNNVSRNDTLYLQAVWSAPPGTVTVTDSLTNTFANALNVVWYVCSSPNSGADTFNVTWTGGSLGVALVAMELQGLNTSSCLDQTGNSAALSVTTNNPIAQATELIIGGFTNIGSVGTGVATFGPGTGYSTVNQIIAGPGLGRLTNFIEVLNQTSALPITTQTATATDFGSQLSLNAVITTWKLTTTGQYIPFFQTIGMPWLPVATQTPGANDCVNWQPSAGSNSFVFGDSGTPCANLFSTTTVSATAPSTVGCNDTTVTVTGATTAMAVLVSPQASPGANVSWSGFVSALNTADVRLCTLVNFSPSAVTYNVRVIQ